MTDFHHRPGAVAFRLLHELRGLLDGIRSDGEITGDELNRVHSWIAENRQFAQIAPFSEIASCLDDALADGVLALDEVEDLLFVIDKLTTVNPHFDAMRAGIQSLMGLLTGIAADGIVRPIEIDHLQRWLEGWAHLKGLWPFDECEAVATAILARRRLPDDMRAVLELAATFPIAGAERPTDPATLLAKGICAVDPDVQFLERSFVFTGESEHCDRDALADHVTTRGGIHHPSLRRDTNYLVVCDKGSPCWAFACYGRKVEKALQLRREGLSVVLVHERDFWDATQSFAPDRPPAPKPEPRPRRRSTNDAVPIVSIRLESDGSLSIS